MMTKQLVDQSAHFLLGGLVVALAIYSGATIPPFVGWFVGWSLGVVREVTEEGSLTSKGSIIDIIFWSIGGLTSSLIF